ncbi:MAG: hybrid nucleoside-diphosphate sugar epimerase/sugar transferase [Pseudomonadota bacterium]
MRIAVTGASGFIGSYLVPQLKDRHDLVLLGRNPDHLSKKFPGFETAAYSHLIDTLCGVDTIVHLAAILPDAKLSQDSFETANVTLTDAIADAGIHNGIKRFIFTTTLGWHDNAYSRTKKNAELLLKEKHSLEVTVLRLPNVYGDEFRGKLAKLNQFPPLVQRIVFPILASLRPTVHADRVCQEIEAAILSEEPSDQFISDKQINNPVYSFVKRIIDLGFAIGVIVFLWWVILLIYAAVRITSPGPGIFAQKRVGQDGTEFTLYKFRTMFLETKSAATHEIGSSQVTAFGKILRKFKLDELPQIWNILRNEISLVGPRPCLPSQTVLIEERESRHVLQAKPGITGLAQINDIDMSDPVRLAKKDAEYLSLRTLLLDIKIILATALGKGANDRVS